MKNGKSNMRIHRAAIVALLALPSCASLTQTAEEKLNPIENPFGDFQMSDRGSGNSAIVLRTKQGEKSFEVELPEGDGQAISNFVVPMNGGGSNGVGGRGIASVSESAPVQARDYAGIRPTPADREILAALPKGSPQEDWKREEIESSLGLVPQEGGNVEADASYLAGLDTIKRLFREKRFEACLIELDGMIQKFPNSPKLFEMRGSVLDRLGYADLAMKSWSQAMEFNPGNESLKKFIERRNKMQTRRLASP